MHFGLNTASAVISCQLPPQRTPQDAACINRVWDRRLCSPPRALGAHAGPYDRTPRQPSPAAPAQLGCQLPHSLSARAPTGCTDHLAYIWRLVLACTCPIARDPPSPLFIAPLVACRLAHATWNGHRPSPPASHIGHDRSAAPIPQICPLSTRPARFMCMPRTHTTSAHTLSHLRTHTTSCIRRPCGKQPSSAAAARASCPHVAPTLGM